MGFKLQDVHGLGGRHIEALAKSWVTRGLAPSTIQNNLSVFRTFSEWIGKAGMVESSAKYVGEAASRSSINTEDKSWSAKGVDATSKIAEVTVKDPRVGLQLELQQAFGLRAREAMQLRPHLADKGTYLIVNLGTKGGRDRVVPIATAAQRDLLERAKKFCDTKSSSTSDQTKSLAQVKNHYNYVLRECGISRKDGITSHGLRHGYANDSFKAKTGVNSPVRGGELTKTDRETDRAARLEIAEELGHSREDVTTHYLGR